MIFLCSCDSKESKEEMLFESSNTRLTSSVLSEFRDDIEFRASLMPNDYYLEKYIRQYKTSGHLDSLRNSISTDRVLIMEFESNETNDLLLNEFTHRDYDAAVNYMAFTIENDFKAVTASLDTLDAIGVTFERNFKVAPFKRILVNFTGIPENEIFQVIYNDHLFGKGQIIFDFNKMPIKL